MKIAVIDGQGGGIGKAIVEKLRSVFNDDTAIIALGTNAVVTSLMLKAGAHEGASGENAIVINAPKVDFIMGSVGIIAANTMLGELTPRMAEAITGSPAKKLLIPLNRCGLYVIGTRQEPLLRYIDEAIALIKELSDDCSKET
ncbi:MAG: DUF3842 family protein [Treponema sp.]|nr:DUF3842 family protein [Treponema sp.]